MAKKIRGRNEGSLYQRPNGSWRAQISINGKREGKTFPTKRESLAWLRKIQIQVGFGHDIEGSKITLKEYLTQWIDTSNVHLRDKTLRQYKGVIKNHIIPYLGSVQLKELNLARIERHYAELRNNGLSSRSTKLVHSVLHKALKKAVRYNLIIANPATGASLPRYRPPEMKVLDANQVSQFLIAAQGSYYEALYHLAVHTGMRQGEMFGLKWDDLRWQSGVLLVQRQVQREPGQQWKYLEPKTRAGNRTIALGEGVLQILRLHQQNQIILKAVAGQEWKENGLVFPNRRGKPGDQSNLRKDFKAVLKQAGLPVIRFHDLRHTAASLMLNNGIPSIVVSKRLGHAKPSTTMDIYGHLYHEMQEEAARVMDELVTPIQINKTDLCQNTKING